MMTEWLARTGFQHPRPDLPTTASGLRQSRSYRRFIGSGAIESAIQRVVYSRLAPIRCASTATNIMHPSRALVAMLIHEMYSPYRQTSA